MYRRRQPLSLRGIIYLILLGALAGISFFVFDNLEFGGGEDNAATAIRRPQSPATGQIAPADSDDDIAAPSANEASPPPGSASQNATGNAFTGIDRYVLERRGYRTLSR